METEEISGDVNVTQGNTSNENEKMKMIIRQLYREKEKLKKDIETECKAHSDDVSRLTEEIKIVKNEIERLNETDNLPPPPSPEEEEKIASLSKQLTDLKASLKSLQNSIFEANRTNSVIQKEVEQYKITVSALEDDLTTAEEDRLSYLKFQSKLITLQDEKKEKQRKLDELIVNDRLSAHELQTAKQKLDLYLSGPIGALYEIKKQPSIQIIQPVSHLGPAVQKAYRLISNTSDFENDNEKMNNFLLSLPNRIRTLKEENQSIREQCNQFKKKCQSLEKPQSLVADESMPSMDKMKQTIRQLAESNQKKTIKLRELKDLAERQHTALQRVSGVPKDNESIIKSLYQVLHQLETCDESECEKLCDIGEHLLDAMVGVKY